MEYIYENIYLPYLSTLQKTEFKVHEKSASLTTMNYKVVNISILSVLLSYFRLVSQGWRLLGPWQPLVGFLVSSRTSEKHNLPTEYELNFLSNAQSNEYEKLKQR